MYKRELKIPAIACGPTPSQVITSTSIESYLTIHQWDIIILHIIIVYILVHLSD